LADAARALGFAFAAARGVTRFAADFVFGLAAAFDFAAALGFVALFGLAVRLGVALVLALTALAFATFALADSFLAFALGTGLTLRLPLVAVLAAALPLFALFAMMLASNRLFRALNPRGVLATALRTFQAFLSAVRHCHHRHTLLS
jgi:hypothetical protein